MKKNASQISRRNFLALSAAASAAVVVNFPTRAPAALATADEAADRKKKYPIGLELYSVRNQLSRDLQQTLRSVAQIGYEAVEFYAPYRDWTLPFGKEVAALMADLGLRCYSTHNNIASFTPGEAMAKAIELNQILGARYLILASPPAEAKGIEGWKKLCVQLNEAVEQLAPHGLSAGYHNHEHEWAKLDDNQRVMDLIAANTPKEFVLQLDVGTCVAAGADPVGWIKSNPGRIKCIHLKDWAPGGPAQEKGYRVIFGEGVSPWKEIMAAAESVGGVEYYLLEQEGSRFPELETAQRCLDAWKQVRSKS